MLAHRNTTERRLEMRSLNEKIISKRNWFITKYLNKDNKERGKVNEHK